MKEGTLFIVATPIGNLEDITYRAVRILREVDYILAEDTRTTGILLKKYEIKTPVRRYDAHASEKTHRTILDDLESGKSVALVSDAGTPCVSDPGVLLVARARGVGIRMEAIPGASAVTTAFSIAGISGNSFTFLGFAPQKKGRETFFKKIAESSREHPQMFYESVHRFEKSLTSLAACLDDTYTVTIARELTKIHEEVVQGTIQDVRAHFLAKPETVRGEFVVIVSI